MRTTIPIAIFKELSHNLIGTIVEGTIALTPATGPQKGPVYMMNPFVELHTKPTG